MQVCKDNVQYMTNRVEGDFESLGILWQNQSLWGSCDKIRVYGDLVTKSESMGIL